MVAIHAKPKFGLTDLSIVLSVSTPTWSSHWPLVGRESELQSFDRAWASRHIRSFVIAGPAGVGKSRLAQECFGRAVGGAVRGVRVSATAAAAAVPLSAVAHLIPPNTDFSDPVDGFAAVARALAGASGKDRWVVLVDDLPLLDAASKVLLRQLIRADIARLIATVRTGGDSADNDSLAEVDAIYRVDLGPFDDEQVRVLLRSVLGGPVSRRTVLALSAASSGNVLYLRELVHGALRAGQLVDNGEIWGLVGGRMPSTPQLGELIGNRLASAPPAARGVLELLALCESLPLADAGDVTAMDVLVGLESAGLIRVHQDERRTGVTLAHPLYAEVLRAALPTLRRRVLLLDQAERAQSHGMRRHDDALHVATWRLGATGTADPEMLVQAAVLARHAHDYRQAATLLAGIPESGLDYRARLLHGEALMQLGRWREADTILAQAQHSAESGEHRVTATLMRTTNLFWMAGRDEALQVNEIALAQTFDPESRYILTVNDAAMRTISGEPIYGLSVLEGIAADVHKATDTSIWSLAAMSETMGLALTGRTEDAVSLARNVYSTYLKLDRQARDKQAMGPPPSAHLNNLTVALSEAGRLAEAREVSEKALADTANTQELHTWIWAAYFRGRAEWLSGDAGAARHFYAEAIAEGEQHNEAQVLFQAWGGLAACAAILGDLSAAETALASRIGLPRMGMTPGEERLGEAWLLAAGGQLAQARAVLAEAAATARATGHVTSEMLLLTDIARLGGAGQTTARMAELAQICDGAFAPARLHFVAAMADEDPSGLLTVADELEQIGANLLAAEAAAAATAMWRRGGDVRRATAANNRALRSLVHCPGVRTPALTITATASLTPREREIALLAARGRSSKEIAAALTLSVRTVDNHLQSVYGKLGIANRRELTATLRSAAPP